MSTLEPEDPADQTPQDQTPESGAAGDGAGAGDADGAEQGHEQAWAEIVANYGEWPEAPAADTDTPHGTDSDGTDPVGVGAGAALTPTTAGAAAQFDDDVDEEPVWEDDDIFLPGEFVEPEPAPVGWHGARSLAWVGVLGSTVMALLLTVISQLTNWRAPSIVTYTLVMAFLGGFGYLVATMRKEPNDPWDDGARV